MAPIVGVAMADGSSIRADKVILAVNGYAGNRDLVARFCPEIAGASYFGAHGSTGEAVLWGEKVGAGLANMAAYQGYAAVAHPHGSLLSWTTIEKGGILLDDGPSASVTRASVIRASAKYVLAQGEFCYAVFDERIFQIAQPGRRVRRACQVRRREDGDDIRAIAKIFGLDADKAAAAFDAYNAAASGKGADAFGRKDFGLAPLTGKLYGCRVVPGLFHTQGGLKIGLNAEVLKPDGTPVPNLFAGGGAAAGISGRAGARGYASGNGLLTAIALGRLAGIAAARQVAGARA